MTQCKCLPFCVVSVSILMHFGNYFIQATFDNPCPVDNWKYYEPKQLCIKAFYGGQYQKKDWKNSKTFCENLDRSRHSRLVVITDVPMVMFIREFWVGLYYVPGTTDLYWVNGENATFVFWKYRQPFLPEAYPCVFMKTKGYHFNTACSWEMNALCEMRVYPDNTTISTTPKPACETIGDCTRLCRTVKGDQSCACLDGYRPRNLTGDQDQDECQTENGGCERHCENIFVDRKCECFRGCAQQVNVSGYNTTRDVSHPQAPDKTVGATYKNISLVVVSALVPAAVIICCLIPRLRESSDGNEFLATYSNYQLARASVNLSTMSAGSVDIRKSSCVDPVKQQ